MYLVMSKYYMFINPTSLVNHEIIVRYVYPPLYVRREYLDGYVSNVGWGHLHDYMSHRTSLQLDSIKIDKCTNACINEKLNKYPL